MARARPQVTGRNHKWKGELWQEGGRLKPCAHQVTGRDRKWRGKGDAPATTGARRPRLAHLRIAPATTGAHRLQPVRSHIAPTRPLEFSCAWHDRGETSCEVGIPQHRLSECTISAPVPGRAANSASVFRRIPALGVRIWASRQFGARIWASVCGAHSRRVSAGGHPRRRSRRRPTRCTARPSPRSRRQRRCGRQSPRGEKP